jgi:hypothetical protein
MKISVFVSALLIASSVAAADDVKCRSRVMFPPTQLSVTVPFEKTRNGVFIRAKVNGKSDPLWFVVDSGAARTLISEPAAKRAAIQGTEKSMLRGAGAGVVPVTVAKNITLAIDVVTIEHVDMRIANLTSLTPLWGRAIDGIIGHDLLCRSVVTIDYDSSRLTMTHPAVFQQDGKGESLKLYTRNGWSFVEGTIKVTGLPAVIDTFLVDSGSQDAVNHPIIRDSKGPLRTVTTGNGLGAQLAGVLGPNEWFRLGRFTIGSTQSTCCASEVTSRQIGAAVLSRFRVTFDYPRHRLILETSRR